MAFFLRIRSIAPIDRIPDRQMPQDHDPKTQRTAAETLRIGLRGRCPRCGSGSLFDGFLSLRDRCDVCDLDFGFADTADGPAFFVICLTCIPVVAFSVWLEVGFGAAYWLNALLTLPLLFVFCVLPLRPIKGMMVAQQYRHDAKEGVWDDKPRRQP